MVGWPSYSHPPFLLPKDILQVALHIPRLKNAQLWACQMVVSRSIPCGSFIPFVSEILGVACKLPLWEYLYFKYHPSCSGLFLLWLFLIPLPEGLPEDAYIGASESMFTDWLAGKLWLRKIKAKLALGETLRITLKIKDSEECLEGG